MRRIDFKTCTASSLAVYMFEWFSQQPTSTFLHPYFAMRKLKYSTQKLFSEFQQVAAVETCDNYPLQIVLEALFIFNMIYIHWICFQTRGSLFFWVARVVNTLRKPFEFKWSEVRFNRKQTSMTRVPYNKLLTNLASSSRTGECWPSVVLYGPCCTRSVLSQPWANIPRYGPCARLVRGYSIFKWKKFVGLSGT